MKKPSQGRRDTVISPAEYQAVLANVRNRQFLFSPEFRGYQFEGALWSPGQFRLDVEPGETATLVLSTDPWDSITAIHPRGPAVDDPRYALYPIYISHLDKGRIVGLVFGPFTFPNRAERTKLLVRSVRWLAGRPVE